MCSIEARSDHLLVCCLFVVECQLHAIEKLTNSQKKAGELKSLISARESAISFDTSWYVDLREKSQMSKAVVSRQAQPLIVTPGCLMITDQRIYFQPFNNVSLEPVHRYPISDIERIHRVRSSTHHTLHLLPRCFPVLNAWFDGLVCVASS